MVTTVGEQGGGMVGEDWVIPSGYGGGRLASTTSATSTVNNGGSGQNLVDMISEQPLKVIPTNN